MEAQGPLRGVRVLVLGGVGPAQFGAMLLADQGADVVVITRPDGVPVADRELGPDGIDVLGRGCARIEADLKDGDRRDAVLRMARDADVVVEGFRPGVAERLGLGPEDCTRENPRVVYARMTGYGQDGPLARQAGHDINYLARTGALHAIGRRGGPPQVPLNLLADYGGGGMLLAFGVCAALVERERSGLGQVIDTAMVDGVAALMASVLEKMANGHWVDERGVNALDTGMPNYDVYPTADGGWMAVGAREPVFHRRLLDTLGLGDLPLDVPEEERETRRATIAARFRTRSRDEWSRVFHGIDACVSPVLSLREAARDEHLRARGSYRGPEGAVQPGVAPRFSRTPGAVRDPGGVQELATVASRWRSPIDRAPGAPHADRSTSVEEA